MFPPVTPVCFASMYSGLEPQHHGIMKYEKPVLKVNTVYDDHNLCNLKAMELIEQDRHDMIVLYNGNYDWAIHRFRPEGKRSLKELRANIDTCCKLCDAILKHWKIRNTALFFSPDHGCHNSILPPGNHGKDIPEDMNIRHFCSFFAGKNRL